MKHLTNTKALAQIPTGEGEPLEGMGVEWIEMYRLPPPSRELLAFSERLIDHALNGCGVDGIKLKYKIGPGYDPNEVRVQGEDWTVTPTPITKGET